MYFSKVRRKIFKSHVLEHSDTRDFVVGAGARKVAVVEQLHHAAVLKPELLDAAAHVLELILRQRDPGGMGTVTLDGTQNQRSPSAADIEKPLARLDFELVQYVIELLNLRRIECVLLAAIIGARVHHV